MESIIVLYQRMPRQIKSNNSCEDTTTSSALYLVVIFKTAKAINCLHVYWLNIHKTT
uniref:Uncharacterized protein n=1 Tax=Arundo donax TaxID=35708 RepID=A0A0A8ZTE1_ARUDO